MKIIEVDIPGNEYQVTLGRGLKDKIASFISQTTKDTSVLIVADDFFKNSYVAELEKVLTSKGLNCHLYFMEGGKASKSFAEVLKIFGELEVNNFARDSTIIAIGGGVVGDLAGFVASTWYRGMNLIHVPTTLMGMADSSIGGKVAINFRETINAVGNYHHPVANFMDLEFIDSLPQRDYVAGLAEVVKCALISDRNLFEYLYENKEEILSKKEEHVVYCISKAIEIKVDHVRKDVREGGKRLKLNFGHTLGHAIEMATQTKDGEFFRHGEGVSLGISAIIRLSRQRLDFSEEEINKIIDLLQSLNLPTSFSAAELNREKQDLIKECQKLAGKDKKRKDSALRLILLDEIGMASIHHGKAEDPEIEAAFASVIRE